MKKPTPLPRASHVNKGTSVPHEELPWPDHDGTVLRHRKLHLERADRTDVTDLGGLVLPLALLRRVKAPAVIDERVEVLKLHLPYHESDHIISQALMLYAGGTCLEDMAILQQDPALLKMLGAERTPDPTTSGDFLRRFEPRGKLEVLRSAIDEIQDRVWKNPKRWNWRKRRRSKEKRPIAVLYLDGKTKEFTAVTKEGADFDYMPSVVHRMGSVRPLRTCSPRSCRSRPSARVGCARHHDREGPITPPQNATDPRKPP